MTSSFLRNVLATESRAYGFTIAFWGSGAILINEFGVPGIEGVLAYATGSIIGFALITLAAFRQPLENVEYEETEYMVFSMIHFLSSLAPILFAYWATGLEQNLAFLLSGASVSMNYNLLMVVEESVAEKIAEFESSYSG
ncbi:MAG: hypothetical protein ABEJ03_04650 [Candidatus Nanohaloarchaea archaeon]